MREPGALDDDSEVELARIELGRSILDARVQRLRAATGSRCFNDGSPIATSIGREKEWVNQAEVRRSSIPHSAPIHDLSDVYPRREYNTRPLNAEAAAFFSSTRDEGRNATFPPGIDGATRYLLVADLKRAPTKSV